MHENPPIIEVEQSEPNRKSGKLIIIVSVLGIALIVVLFVMYFRVSSTEISKKKANDIKTQIINTESVQRQFEEDYLILEDINHPDSLIKISGNLSKENIYLIQESYGVISLKYDTDELTFTRILKSSEKEENIKIIPSFIPINGVSNPYYKIHATTQPIYICDKNNNYSVYTYANVVQ